MIVISDNSALSPLAEADLLGLLPRLFRLVIIPEAVRSECAHRRAPQPLQDWISQPPDWLQIVPDPPALLTETQGLGPGEVAAITLAWVNRKSSKLILDEKRGRHVAEALGLPKTGVIGIIGEAAELGWLDRQVPSDLLITTLTLGEIAKGIERLPMSQKRTDLEIWRAMDHPACLSPSFR